MKNKILSSLAIAATVLLSLIMSSSTMMKTPPPSTCGNYTIFNELSCPIKISYTRYCNGIICSGPTPASIPNNSNIVVTGCSGCSGTCMVQVTLLDVNGNPTGLPVSVGLGGSTSAVYPVQCSGTGNVNWSATFTSIH